MVDNRNPSDASKPIQQPETTTENGAPRNAASAVGRKLAYGGAAVLLAISTSGGGQRVHDQKLDSTAKGTDANTPAHVFTAQDINSNAGVASEADNDAGDADPSEQEGEAIKNAAELMTSEVEEYEKETEGDKAGEDGIRYTNDTPPAAGPP